MIEKIIAGQGKNLSQGVKNLVGNVERHEYTSAAKIYSKEDIAKVMENIDKAHMPKYETAESRYTSPFALINNKAAADVDFVAETMPQGNKLNIKA